MSLNSTPVAERTHIGFFGRRNAGKSSVVNAVTNQQVSVVSDYAGTTTDPVTKTMELLPLGPVVIIDTPGFDDEGSLGELRVKRTRQTLNRVDIAVLVVDGTCGKTAADDERISIYNEKGIPYIVVYNKCDLFDAKKYSDGVCVSATTGENINQLKEQIAALKPSGSERRICADIIDPGDLVVLVVPIDSAAPKGRLILPQQQTIRDILDFGATAVICRETELSQTLCDLGKKPSLVITDSQAFAKVSKTVPADIPLTSFSILMARYKGFLESAVRGAAAIGSLEDGDAVLIAEGCTHHRQCEDIGTVKLPRWLRSFTGKELKIKFSSGKDFPEDLSGFSLIIHCGGCMLNEREMNYRRNHAKDNKIPITNYGTAIAYMNGILERTLEVFPDILSIIK